MLSEKSMFSDNIHSIQSIMKQNFIYDVKILVSNDWFSTLQISSTPEEPKAVVVDLGELSFCYSGFSNNSTELCWAYCVKIISVCSHEIVLRLKIISQYYY